MEILISVLIVVVIAAVAIWLIKQIPFPAGLQIIQTLLIVIVVVFALIRLFALW
jgi:hypothetical protein